MSRWDIMHAYYVFFLENHGGQGSLNYKRLCKLQTYYHAGYSARIENDDQQAIYDALKARCS